MSRSTSRSRALTLHSSALSDAEHALFSASFCEVADLPQNTIDWEATRVEVSLREARAWLCGRYPEIGSGVVDEILRLFAPATRLTPGAFSAALRLALHAREQPGMSVDRSMAFLQAPVPPSLPRVNTTNPFFSLPTPAPSPEASTRPMLPSRSSSRPTGSDSASTSSGASSIGSRASSASTPARRTSGHAYSVSLSALAITDSNNSATPPPVHPLRRAVTQTEPKTPPPSVDATIRRSPSNPFKQRPNPSPPARPPPLPPRRASTSGPVPILSPFDTGSFPPPPPIPTSAYPYPSSNSNSAGFRPAPPPLAPRTAPAGKSAFSPISPPKTRWTSSARPAFDLEGFKASVQPPTPADSGSDPYSFVTGRRVVSDGSPTSAPPNTRRERTTSTSPSRAAPREDAGAIVLPRALRRTLAGAGWVGAERGERDGLLGT
ncbi:Glycolipid transfer protein [Mycena indigotica]|uniref:Glycolipid transfer protein n=1 Tax=Mycena indigotica TaxID=2126181 RepID=A0A8H6RZ46_9AGAR|nr:Glycolipid transfer protein [Mycena indigotica]KAF7288897.1 Glycolipid transfer protein [Mycena indigotica]